MNPLSATSNIMNVFSTYRLDHDIVIKEMIDDHERDYIVRDNFNIPHKLVSFKLHTQRIIAAKLLLSQKRQTLSEDIVCVTLATEKLAVVIPVAQNSES